MCSLKRNLTKSVFFLTSLLVMVFVFSFRINAQLKINEVSSGTNSDWVELYNLSDESKDLSQFEIRDSTDSNNLQMSGIIEPADYAVFDFSNKLNNGGDKVRLISKLSGELIDEIAYGDNGNYPAADENYALARVPDGENDFVLAAFSKGLSNNSQLIYHTPTPSPTIAPTPPKTPTPIKTPTPTRSPTPTKTPTPIPTRVVQAVSNSTSSLESVAKSSTPTPDEKNEASSSATFPTAVLGDSDNEIEEKDSDSEPEVTHRSAWDLKWFIIFGGLLLLTCGILFYLRKKRQ